MDSETTAKNSAADAGMTGLSSIESGKRPRLRTLLLWLFVFSPAIINGVGIAINAENVPTWDDWERGPLLERYYDGTLDLRYLNGAHINHRILFPRLLIIGMNEMTGGNIVAEIYLSYAFVVLGGVALFLIVRRTIGPSPWVWAVGFLVNLIYFSPLQYQNYLWAVQIAMMIPIACLPTAVLVMITRWAWWKKLIVTLGLAILATHSFAHGLLIWPVVFCLGLLHPSLGGWRHRGKFVGIFGAVGALVIFLYFNWHFETNTHHSYGTPIGDPPRKGTPISEVIEDPKRFKRYFLFAVGSQFARLFDIDPEDAAKNVARTLLVLFGLGVGYMLWKRKDTRQWEALLPWAAFGGFAVSVALLMAVGRSDMSAQRALLTRYLSSTMFLGIALIGMGAYLLYRWQQQAKEPSRERLRAKIAVGVWVGLCVLQAAQWQYGFHKMEVWRFARLQSRAALLYLNHFPPVKTGRLDYEMEFVMKWANYLNDKGLLDPPLFEKPDFGSFKREKMSDALEVRRAGFHGARMDGATILALDGWATLRDPDRIADGVLLTWRIRPQGKSNRDADWKVFGMSEMSALHVPRAPFLDGAFAMTSNYSDKRRYARWKKGVAITSLPEGEVIEVKAWAMDADRMVLQPFREVVEIDRRADGKEPKVRIR